MANVSSKKAVNFNSIESVHLTYLLVMAGSSSKHGVVGAYAWQSRDTMIMYVIVSVQPLDNAGR